MGDANPAAGEFSDEWTGGNCMKTAYDVLVREMTKPNRFRSDRIKKTFARLVHGEVTAQNGPLKGKPYSHAWVEFDGFVYDESDGNPKKDQRIPINDYYSLTQFNKDNAHKYTLRQAKRRMEDTG